MATRYKVRLKAEDGSLVAEMPDAVFRRIDYTTRINAPFAHSIRMELTVPQADLFVLDGQVEIWRADLAAGIDWYLDYEGFHRSEERRVSSDGMQEYVSVGAGYTELTSRAIIYNRQGSVGAAKSGNGESVMKDYVDENIGPNATAANRVVANIMPGLTIEPDGGNGDAWQGDRAYKNLLEVLKEIADATSVDFGIVGTGPATFEFRAKAKPWGADRTVTGLNPTTGLNAAGNAPVTFALGFGNMQTPVYSLNRLKEATAAIILGQGAEEDRVISETTSADITDSRWNRRESVHNANQESEVAALQDVAAAVLDKLQAKETFTFQPVETQAYRLGRDYFLGDIITAVFDDIQRNLQITSIAVQLQEGVESLAISVSNVP